MIKQLLTVPNCINYLESMSFENIFFYGEINDNLYFLAHDEDGLQKEIEFEPNYTNNNITVSTRLSVNDPFVILEIIED